MFEPASESDKKDARLGPRGRGRIKLKRQESIKLIELMGRSEIRVLGTNGLFGSGFREVKEPD